MKNIKAVRQARILRIGRGIIQFQLIAVCVPALFFSCVSSRPAPEETRYVLKNSSRTVNLFPDQYRNSPRMIFDFTLLEVTGPERDTAFFNGFLYSGKDPGRYRDDVVNDYGQKYLENRELAEQESPAVFDWEYIEVMSFYKLKERGMVAERDIYTFTGGAHGMGVKRYYVLDLAEQKILALEDFFQDTGDARLRTLMMDELRRYSGGAGGSPIGAGDSLTRGIFLSDNPDLPRNFFINNAGLGLSWAPYEIAPYSAGTIEIVLPWRQIRPLLRHDAMELLEKFGIYMFM